jgi:hypothetical protein
MQTSENLTLPLYRCRHNLRCACHFRTCGPLEMGHSLGIGDQVRVSRLAAFVCQCGVISPVLTVVEKITFSYEVHHQSSEWHGSVDRSQWREFLRPFANVKTIHVQDDLVSKTFRSLLSDNREPPLELLPNLEEVRYSGGLDALDALSALVDARRVAGHPVSLRMVDNSIFLDDSG